jgi:hypothetical protein
MKSVPIIPQIAYANGKQVTIHSVHVLSVFDDLFSHVVFKYVLLDEHRQPCGEGAYTIKEKAIYDTWDATPEGAYLMVIDYLGMLVQPVIGATCIFKE